MPTYEYECSACGKRFELFQQMTARPARRCALCGERRVRRLVGPGGAVIFRGPGFHVNDYPNKPHHGSPGSSAS